MNASEFGFLPQNDAATNAAALQKAIDSTNDITVDIPGIYDVAGSIFLHGGCHLLFAENVFLRRQHAISGNDGYFFVNRGAFTGKRDEDIYICGLNVIANNIESTAARCVPELPQTVARGEEALNGLLENNVFGLRAHLAFLYVKDIVIKDFTLTDLGDWDYGIQISDFVGAVLDDIRIEGNKDGVHFGPGRDFVLKNGVFRTKDDPIALNADDYSPSAPTIGMIENGFIENCTDLKQDNTYGYFVRIHVGSAVDWFPGIEITHSDSVICNGRMYRAVLPADNIRHVSNIMPTHERGFRIHDGIAWIRIGYSDDAPRVAAVKNVKLRGLKSDKDRDASVIMYMSDNEHHHGWRSGAEVPVCENITFEDFRITGKVKNAFLICSPTENLSFTDCDLNGSAIRFEQGSCGLGKYGASFSLKNVTDFRIDDDDAFRDPADGKPRYRIKY